MPPAPDTAAAPTDEPVAEIVITARRLNEARASIQTQTGASTYTIDSNAIAAIPGGDNSLLNQVVLRAPDVAQDSFGQLHVRGEHNGLQYRLNGIILPEGISVFGQSLDTRIVDSMQLIMGALPAEYGLRTGGIVDLTTKSGILEPHGDASLYGGSHEWVEPSLYHGGSIGKLNYFVTADFLRNALGIESPDGRSTPLHDWTSQYRAFGYFEYLLGTNDRVSLIVGTSHARFQIPDRSGLQPAGLPGITGLGPCGNGSAFYAPPCAAGDSPVLQANGSYAFPSEHLDENQTEITHYGILSIQHSAGSLDVQSSLTGRYSSLTYFPDVLGDLLYGGISSHAFKRDVALTWQSDAAWHATAAHTIRAGLYVQHDRATSNTLSQVLAVGASPDPLTGNLPQLSDVPLSRVDDNGQSQNIYSIYLQDEWKLLEPLTLNFGLRYDHLSAYTTGHQLSPRVNVVWKPLEGTTVHGGYSRYFSPPPFELVGGRTLALYAGTTQYPAVPLATPPLPEKANYYDVGLQQQLTASLSVGLDSYYKQSSDLVDEGQFGAPIILTPFNYRHGKQYGLELTANYVLPSFSAYLNVSTQRARGKQIESSQFNFQPDDLAWIGRHYISLDHEQQYTASAGASYQWRSTQFNADLLFGSGLRCSGPPHCGRVLELPTGARAPNSGHLPYYRQMNVGLVQKLPALGLHAGKDRPSLRFDITNVFDTVYQIRNGTGVGVGAPQYGARRGYFAGISIPF